MSKDSATSRLISESLPRIGKGYLSLLTGDIASTVVNIANKMGVTVKASENVAFSETDDSDQSTCCDGEALWRSAFLSNLRQLSQVTSPFDDDASNQNLERLLLKVIGSKVYRTSCSDIAANRDDGTSSNTSARVVIEQHSKLDTMVAPTESPQGSTVRAEGQCGPSCEDPLLLCVRCGRDVCAPYNNSDRNQDYQIENNLSVKCKGCDQRLCSTESIAVVVRTALAVDPHNPGRRLRVLRRSQYRQMDCDDSNKRSSTVHSAATSNDSSSISCADRNPSIGAIDRVSDDGAMEGSTSGARKCTTSTAILGGIEQFSDCSSCGSVRTVTTACDVAEPALKRKRTNADVTTTNHNDHADHRTEAQQELTFKDAQTIIHHLHTFVDPATGRNFSLVFCVPLTGRTHQIRVHCASLGNPIVGDFLYGGGRIHEFCPNAYEMSAECKQESSTLPVANVTPAVLHSLETGNVSKLQEEQLPSFCEDTMNFWVQLGPLAAAGKGNCGDDSCVAERSGGMWTKCRLEIPLEICLHAFAYSLPYDLCARLDVEQTGRQSESPIDGVRRVLRSSKLPWWVVHVVKSKCSG
eukprot:Lankesteria_metandrocarpae@DN10436_c0_g1_i1.p1